MERGALIFVAGHRGLVGSAIVRQLKAQGFTNLVLRTHAELDLVDGAQVRSFFEEVQPEYVILAAAKVGGIYANSTYPADFIYINLAIQNNVIHSAYLQSVKRLLFLGSSCIYPRHAPQPMKEEHLLTGPLEPTNRPYALAKISGIEMCWSYNRQYGTKYFAVMPTNLYGPGDNYHPENSHVIPALIRRFHEAKLRGDACVTVWGTGMPRREFMYSDDMAEACVYLLNLPEANYSALLGNNNIKAERFEPPLINIGAGYDVSIREIAELVRDVVGYAGALEFDATKPDGSPQKLLDVSRLAQAGWVARTKLHEGLATAYADFMGRGGV
ncbi:MAG: GDP-fucose synthetase [Deltaproteobacteria bacterium HGW-Deltaproteobacteria-8]|jgi:GDP-L-fucose synthase|nr:MAG: GDP-fucose synthetase [Deltaproteobacteria bacterium HGW-Deltaproteobacteria-8]